MPQKTRSIIVETCAFLLIVLFIYASASKLLHYKDYYGEINNQPFDNRLTPLLVWAIPLAELIAAGLLSFKKTQRWGFYSSLFLMTLFTGYIILVLFNYYGRTPCSCGGVLSKLTWTQHLYFNIFFIVVALIGSLSGRLRLVSMPSTLVSH